MLAKVLSTAVLAALLYANIVSASATGPPKTKAQCEKLTDMQWDAKTKKCVKK
jgi:hypothetical protein